MRKSYKNYKYDFSAFNLISCSFDARFRFKCNHAHSFILTRYVFIIFGFYFLLDGSIEGFLSHPLTHTLSLSLSLSILFQVFPEFYIHICNISYIWWQSISLVSSTVVLEIGFDIQRHIPHTMIKAKSE